MPCAARGTRSRRPCISGMRFASTRNWPRRSNLGQFLLERLELEEALAHCQEAVLLSPAFAEAQNNLGNVLRELGRLDEAKTCYAEALRYAPRHAGARPACHPPSWQAAG